VPIFILMLVGAGYSGVYYSDVDQLKEHLAEAMKEYKPSKDMGNADPISAAIDEMQTGEDLGDLDRQTVHDLVLAAGIVCCGFSHGSRKNEFYKAWWELGTHYKSPDLPFSCCTEKLEDRPKKECKATDTNPKPHDKDCYEEMKKILKTVFLGLLITTLILALLIGCCFLLAVWLYVALGAQRHSSKT
jgi:hypothetical protein